MFVAEWDKISICHEELSPTDKNNISKIVGQSEWKSFEKFLNNIIFKYYKSILVDEDVKTARKLITFATAIKKLPYNYKFEDEIKTVHKVRQGGSEDVDSEIEENGIFI